MASRRNTKKHAHLFGYGDADPLSGSPVGGSVSDDPLSQALRTTARASSPSSVVAHTPSARSATPSSTARVSRPPSSVSERPQSPTGASLFGRTSPPKLGPTRNDAQATSIFGNLTTLSRKANNRSAQNSPTLEAEKQVRPASATSSPTFKDAAQTERPDKPSEQKAASNDGPDSIHSALGISSGPIESKAQDQLPPNAPPKSTCMTRSSSQPQASTPSTLTSPPERVQQTSPTIKAFEASLQRQPSPNMATSTPAARRDTHTPAAAPEVDDFSKHTVDLAVNAPFTAGPMNDIPTFEETQITTSTTTYSVPSEFTTNDPWSDGLLKTSGPAFQPPPQPILPPPEQQVFVPKPSVDTITQDLAKSNIEPSANDPFADLKQSWNITPGVAGFHQFHATVTSWDDEELPSGFSDLPPRNTQEEHKIGTAPVQGVADVFDNPWA
ncbi:hypothetical protein BZG36_01726 [Bifiguratus adelaidae]|uniref:Uncharacterized protein n=1 Tax=Bifiguratus adelaidae TaxID=1938954 RepID=A0A261Y4P9_9FUNG|nr:hypothetical protein BZG36_01726 [Bifiguratus adelaidae]